MAWYSVESTLPRHPKTYRLAKEAGVSVDAAISGLVRLWCWAIDHAPDGDLCDCLDEQIGDICGVSVEALISAGYIDRDQSGTRLHDWLERRSNYREATTRAERRQVERARKLSADCPVDVRGLSADCPAERRGEREEIKEIPEVASDSGQPPTREPEAESSPVKMVWDHYAQFHKTAKLGSKIKSLIKARLTEGFLVQDLIDAIDGCHANPWNNGKDPKTNGKKFLGAALIFRDSDQVNRFIECKRAKKSAFDDYYGYQTESDGRAINQTQGGE